ncbi:hypothetical protein KPL37_01035 [Clostridium frigoris]|uniref:Uncharacterized protein n=1 Tax=Clostridium frigoris TaxID=205327 RepID=A0ABS6BN51_9CLOT|nr:hypothetical protein [Clostridium frigoris]MBU3158358.1 hypothetical protein [Clostridium frigoris]
MKYIFSRAQILTGILTGGILLSAVNITFASPASSVYFNGKAPLTSESKQINTKRQKGLDTNYDNIAIVKTITQNQANKIRAVINKDESSKRANFKNTKTVTDQERKIYVDSNNINHINPFTALIDNGTITEVQAEKIIMKQLYLYHDKMINSML